MKRGRETLLAALFFLVWTAVATWPQVLHMDDALSDFGDAKLNARILQWDFAQTFRNPLDLFQLNFFHPARDVLAFSENLYGVSLFGFPLLAAGASAVLNYNVLLLLGMWSSAIAAWALARRITGDPLASAAAGVIYAFVPWRMEQIPHLQHQWGAFLCLLLLFLVTYLEEGRRRDLVLYAVAFAWNALANVHYALFSGLLVALTLVWAWLVAIPGGARRLRNAALATLAGGLVFLPFAAGYRAAEKLYGFRRYIGEIAYYSGWWTDFLSAGARNFFWGPITQRWRVPERDLFPGALALLLAGAAIVLLWRARRPSAGVSAAASAPKRRRALVRAADAVTVVLRGVCLVALLHRGLTIGPIRLGDPSRIFVIAAVVVFARLAAVFPGSRYQDLGDFVRRGPLPPRAFLFLAIGILGILVALGVHTPFYRFLVQSFGFAFRAIRAPARGIVLAHIALAILAAWGLSLLWRRRSAPTRAVVMSGALAVLGFEYRAFPVELFPAPPAPASVYSWMRDAPFPGGAVEWPLGMFYDFEYILRQAEHGKPILNGYSGFFPRDYIALEVMLKQRPIPDEVWREMGKMDASLLVYHSHETHGPRVLAYADAIERGLASGGLDVVRQFPHGGGEDFVFVARGAPWRDAVVRGESRAPGQVRVLFDRAVARMRTRVGQLEPPSGGIHLPAEGQVVSPGFYAFGWAIDDSGIAEVKVSTELGPVGSAELRRPWPGLDKVYPGYPGVDRGGYGFGIPNLPPGPHELVIVFVAQDGGRTETRRRFSIAN